MGEEQRTPGPLHDVRVLDLSRVLAGPFCTMLLGDLGADVIKVEQPGRGDDTRQWGPPWAGGESAYYLCANRNKRSITLNFKHPEGQAILLRLISQSDIVVENFRPGTLERLGLGYDTLAERYPHLIWCTITGYGLEGPYADRAGYDFVAQGECGLMSITGEPNGEPMKVGVAVVDLFAGLFATSAILAALHARIQTGRGQRIDVPLLSAGVAMLANVGSNYLVSGELPKRYGNAHPNIVPYQTFRTRDGWITVAVGNDRQFRQLCQILGEPQLADDPRFATNPQRVQHRETLIPLLQERFLQRDAAEWLMALYEAGIPAGPINTIADVVAHPQIRYRGQIVTVPHPTAGTIQVIGPPFLLSGTPVQIRRAPPLLGEHTDDVLRELLGLGEDAIARLRADGVI